MYQLKGRTLPDGTQLPSIFSDTPWDIRVPGNTGVEGLRDVAAIAFVIAIVDPRSRVKMTDTQLAALAGEMNDFSPTMKPEDLAEDWQRAVKNSLGTVIPATSNIRVYSRFYSLSHNN